MASFSGRETVEQFQKGYRAVPISEADKESALRLCAVVREAPDPVAGIFVLLRDTTEESVFLGCLLDKGDHVHLWVELWIQNIDNLEASIPTHHETFSNHVLDERWKGAPLSSLAGIGRVKSRSARKAFILCRSTLTWQSRNRSIPRIRLRQNRGSCAWTTHY